MLVGNFHTSSRWFGWGFFLVQGGLSVFFFSVSTGLLSTFSGFLAGSCIKWKDETETSANLMLRSSSGRK